MSQQERIPIDQEVLRAARDGDAQAFERIVFCYEDKIYRFIVPMVGPVHAEDLAQETFLKLYQNIHKFNGNGTFNAWIYTIARTTVYDWLRKEQKRKDTHIIDDNDHGYEPTSQRSSERNSLEQAATKIDTRQAISKLSIMYKEIIVLYYWEDHTYDEISDILGISINTVKTRIRRAKQQLKVLLNELNGETM